MAHLRPDALPGRGADAAPAVDAGITLFDVGVYGTSERPPVFTDVLFSAMVRAAGLRRDEYLFRPSCGWRIFGESLREQLEIALFRGGVEHADLVIVGEPAARRHRPAALSPTWPSCARAGLIRQWGVNNWSPASIRAAHDFAVPTVCPARSWPS